jgi:hypothetical protein
VKKRTMRIWLIAFVPMIIICLFLLLLSRVTKGTLRELPQRRIRPMVKRFTGRELPGKVEDLRAIFRSYRGVEAIFLAFQTDQQGCSYILDAFAGKHVKMHEFPPAEGTSFDCTGILVFHKACWYYQKELGVTLFDEDLINRVLSDSSGLEYANTGRYPEGTVTGYYLAGASFDRSSKLWRHHVVLVFEDRGLVYLYAAR